jgi:diguanylate cyclase (GGDEF)-like protein/PAS domain S-box-containing protein
VSASARAEFEALLDANPGAVLAAIGPEDRLVPLPASIELKGQSVFDEKTALDLIAPQDQALVLDAWSRIDDEPIVRVELHVLGSPDHLATVTFFDVRDEYGVRMVALEADDPSLMDRALETLDSMRRGVGHVSRDATAVFVAVDAATTAMLGWTPEELIGRRSIEIVHPDDHERAIEAWMAMRGGTRTVRVRARYRHAHGHYVWVEVTNDNRLDDPDLRCVLSEIVDISEEMAQLEALRDREHQLARLAEALPIGICHLRADRAVLFSNQPLVAMLGRVDTVDALIASVAASDQRNVQGAIDNAFAGRTSQLEVSVVTGAEVRRCELTFRTLTSDDEESAVDGVIVCAADVTDRSRLRSELEHRASHDALSGCLNRAATVGALERALRDSVHVAVAYIDLDSFKSVNDELGHAAGDELLRVVAARVRSVTRPRDWIGRIGGDEFVVVCPQAEGEFDLQPLVDRLTDAINGDVVFAKERIPLRASVGAALSYVGEVDAEAVLTRADAAMYETKRRRRDSVLS